MRFRDGIVNDTKGPRAMTRVYELLMCLVVKIWEEDLRKWHEKFEAPIDYHGKYLLHRIEVIYILE